MTKCISKHQYNVTLCRWSTTEHVCARGRGRWGCDWNRASCSKEEEHCHLTGLKYSSNGSSFICENISICLQSFVSVHRPTKTICLIHFLPFFFFISFSSFTSLNLKMNLVSSWIGCTRFLSIKVNPAWMMKRKMKVRDIWVNIRWDVCFGKLSCLTSTVWRHAWRKLRIRG